MSGAWQAMKGCLGGWQAGRAGQGLLFLCFFLGEERSSPDMVHNLSLRTFVSLLILGQHSRLGCGLGWRQHVF